VANVIIHLGGDPTRIYETIQTARNNPDALIIVSSEGNPVWVDQQLQAAGISRDRYVFDFNAWDTVTNFTETKRWVMQQRPRKLFVVTNEFHMPRAETIAHCVFWREGVRVIACPMADRAPRLESWQLVLGDVARALLWRLTGILLFDPKVKADRMPGIDREKASAEVNNVPIA
jgi:uncharacterized SAM-binding protein YcdF (DUF218 family)